MKKETAKKILGVFKWLYIIGGVLLLAAAVLIFTNSNADFVNEIINSSNVETIKGIETSTIISIAFVIGTIICFIKSWLFKRAIDDGKKSTLLMILLILSAASSVYNVIMSFGISTIITACIDILVLYAVIKLRNDK